jgi:hypothetical protein
MIATYLLCHRTRLEIVASIVDWLAGTPHVIYRLKLRGTVKSCEPVTDSSCGVHYSVTIAINLVRCYVEVSIKACEVEANQVSETACHTAQSSPQVERT